jgi:hypothetical protein
MQQGANYNGTQPNNTAYIKNFVRGPPTSLWKTITYGLNINSCAATPTNAITPASPLIDNVYIPGNLYVDGSIVNPSDVYLKDKIEDLDNNISIKLTNLRPTQFVFKSDIYKKTHYGFIAHEFEEHFPELVVAKIDKDVANLKAINYLELVPLLVYQIQKMQREIDELKTTLSQMN